MDNSGQPERGPLSLAIPAVSMRPTPMGRQHAVSSGHYLATIAANRVLDAGGNAIDAGVTASMALAVLQPDIVSFAGVAPTLIYVAKLGRVVSLPGLGYWPAATDIDRLRAMGDGFSVPEGLVRTVVPAAPAAHIAALRKYGTISFKEAVGPALELARDGFAAYPFLAESLRQARWRFERWPSSSEIFVPGGRTPEVGELFVQRDLARTLEGMIQAESAATGDRDNKLRAVHDYFYRGPIADAIVAFQRENGGFLSHDDLARFEVEPEASIHTVYRGTEVHSCDTWCQGIVLLETLKLIEHDNLRALGHNSPAYVHLLTEALNLSFADREAYVGDPKFMKVPTDVLLSEPYARQQRARIQPEQCFGEMPRAGDFPGLGKGYSHDEAASSGPVGMSPDTIYACVMDKDGNAYSATLSDTSHDAPVVPGIGMVISTRGHQSRLQAGHPAQVAPGKRPRLTPSPALAMRDGKPYLCFGTPGGDVQSQAMLQVFLNITEFGMQVQQAVEAPRFSSANFPNSFAPHDYMPGRLCLEANMPQDVFEAMRVYGHDVQTIPVLPAMSGAVCAVLRDPRSGLFHAGADPRREAYALAW